MGETPTATLLSTRLLQLPSMPKNAITCALISLICYLCLLSPLRADDNGACLQRGQWALPAPEGVARSTADAVLSAARTANVVLLGEAHDDADHHLWQLQALGMLLGQRGDLVIGMEMFPRRVQAALDRWIAGRLSEEQLLEQTDWNRVWRFDPELYLPILRFARLNRIRVVALNVERSLIAETGNAGWDAVAPERREGVTDPAPAPSDYRDLLRASFFMHGEHREAPEEPDGEASQAEDPAFEYFVQAQLVWDRAFAQAIAEASASYPQSLIVGIIGSGHLRYGHGVPHQLDALGIGNTIVWLPASIDTGCAELAGISDAVFAIAGSERREPPRLGVYLQDSGDGAEIREVVPDSVAATAGLAAGDRIVSAAGVQVRSSNDVIAIVRQSYPGTWLPMTVTRDGKDIDIIARFPAARRAVTPGDDSSRAAEPDD